MFTCVGLLVLQLCPDILQIVHIIDTIQMQEKVFSTFQKD